MQVQDVLYTGAGNESEAMDALMAKLNADSSSTT